MHFGFGALAPRHSILPGASQFHDGAESSGLLASRWFWVGGAASVALWTLIALACLSLV